MAYTYEYPRPAVTSDILVFAGDEDKIKILLIQRAQTPFQGMWALPGGFMDMDETIEQTAARELEEETGISGIDLHQFRVYSALNRDPRHRTVTVTFMALLDEIPDGVRAGDDAGATQWFNVNTLPMMAFDHGEIVRDAIAMLLSEE